MAKKTVRKIAAKDADQYMLRLPPGLRDRIAQRAAENGRSMNTEILDAIEHHLLGADRVTQLWDFVNKHRDQIGWITGMAQDIERLEIEVRQIDERARPERYQLDDD